MCDSDVDFDFDQLVSCDMCGVTVHQSCYGVPELPGVDDMWLCRACELKVGSPPHSILACLRMACQLFARLPTGAHQTFDLLAPESG